MNRCRDILFLKQTFRLRGGLEKYCLLLADALSKAGYTIYLLTLEAPTQELSYNVVTPPSFCSRLFKKISCFSFLFFDSFVKKTLQQHPKALIFGFDRHLVHLDLYRAGNGCHKAYLERRKKEAGFCKKIFLFLNPLHWLTLLSERKTYAPRCPHIICNSRLVQKEIEHYYPNVDRTKLHIIHNGVDWIALGMAFEARLYEQTRRREQFSVPNGHLHIVLVGNEWHRKGVDILIKALQIAHPRLLEKHILWHVTICGKERHPESFIELATSYGLQNHFRFFPQSVSSIELFQSADVCVIPSRYDPFANVTVEALAMGLWVITTPENGGSEVLQEGVNGIVAKECSEQALAEALLHSVQAIATMSVSKESIRESARALDTSFSLRKYFDLVMLAEEQKNRHS